MAQAIAGALAGGSPVRVKLAVRPEHAGKSGRADQDGHGEPGAEHVDRQVTLGHALQRARQQGRLAERRLVAPKRDLVLGAAIGEVEHRPWQHPHRGTPEARHVQVALHQQVPGHDHPAASPDTGLVPAS
jgi:hypothetical protein